MQKTTFIYALCEPGTRTVRYIGKANDPKRRFQEHLSRSFKYDSYLGRWLRLVASRGERPELVLLREVVGNGSEAERRYIRLAKGCKMRLVNGTGGGEGCLNPSPETREKLSAAMRGKNHYNFGGHLSDEHKAAISATKTGVKQSPEHCAAISQGQTGRKDSIETRSKKSAASTGEKNGMFGKPHTPEACAAMSAARRGKKKPPFTLEHCAAISTGKKAANARRKERDLEIEWALAPYTLE